MGNICTLKQKRGNTHMHVSIHFATWNNNFVNVFIIVLCLSTQIFPITFVLVGWSSEIMTLWALVQKKKPVWNYIGDCFYFILFFYFFYFYAKYKIMYYVKSQWMKVTSINWLTITSGKQNYVSSLLSVTKNKIRKYIIIFWFPVFDSFT